MFDSKTKLLENYINYCSTKTKVISKNIANIGTEGYNRQDVQFKGILEDELHGRLKTGESSHVDKPIGDLISKKGYKVVTVEDGEIYSGVNNVDIDNEMAQLAENTLKFKFASKKINNYYANLQSVIKGGGR